MLNGGEGKEGDVKKEGAEGAEGAEKKVEQRASELAEQKLKQAASEKAVAVYESLNQRYKDDPSFRAEFDKIWAGTKEEREAAGTGAGDEGEELEPIEQMRKELAAAKEQLAKTSGEIEELRNLYGYDKLTGRRENINVRYESDFRKMAEGIGYDPGSDAYETLYGDVLREGRMMAKKFGLVNEDGSPDPLKEYKPEFLKEAFTNAFERHKRAGFADGWERKRKAESQKRNEVQDELSPYFDPKKMKTPEARAAALEKAFRHKFGNTKMV